MIARILPTEEWGRLGSAEITELLPHVQPQQAAVVVVEDGDRIVATWTVVRIVHLEGAWIHPDYRNPGVTRRLLRKTLEVAAEWAGDWVWTGATSDDVRGLLTRMGARRMPVDSYVVPLKKEAPCQPQ